MNRSAGGWLAALALTLAGCSERARPSTNPANPSLDAALDGAPDGAPDASPDALPALPAFRNFRKLMLDDQFRAEGVAVFDVNADGRPDIVTDQYWYSSPEFSRHEIRVPETFEPETTYSHSNAVFPSDVDADGWIDIIVAPFPGLEMGWYRNPQGDGTRHWSRHVIAAYANVETPIFVDLFGDGSLELVMGVRQGSDAAPATLAWLTPSADPFEPWTVHAISSPGVAVAEPFSHGLGAGDLNGDGKSDVLTSTGWFESPADLGTSPWAWHPLEFFANECSHMFVWDVNGDQRADVVSSNPHHYGVWWWEQLPSSAGTELAFSRHLIDDSFSESHALRLDDLDADGVPELVTGKRFYSHGKNEPGALDPSLLVYYRRVLEQAAPGGARFERTTVDESSGVGTQFEIADVSGDALPDIIISNKRGLFYFERDARCDGLPAEWLALLNGSDLRGWYPWFPSSGRVDPKRIFSVEDRLLHILDIPLTDEDQEFGYIATLSEFSDFRVRFDYRWGDRQFNPTRRDGWPFDSGFFVTVVGPDMIWPRGLECQVQLGDTGDIYAFDRVTFSTKVTDPSQMPPTYAEFGTPYTTPRRPDWGPTRVARSEKADSATDWNHVELTVFGETTEYRINGTVVMRGTARRQPSAAAPDDPTKDVPLLRGRIAIQQEGAEVFFRNVEIQGLSQPACARR